jgi:hypothetical protein
MACKHVEIFAPPLIDACNVMSYRCTLEDMRNSVNHILDALGFDIRMVTGIDVDASQDVAFTGPLHACELIAMGKELLFFVPRV